MHPTSRRPLAALVPLLLATVLLVVAAGCSSDGSSADSWNEERLDRGFDRAANRRAEAVLARMADAGIECTARQTESFSAVAGGYQKVELPVPLGSASCTGPGGENLLVEVFPKQGYPSGADFMARKRALICKKGLKLGKLPDGTNNFEGVPYVIGADGTWVVEPDSFTVNEQIAKALDLKSSNACAGVTLD